MNIAQNAVRSQAAGKFVPDRKTARVLLGFLAGLRTDADALANSGYEPDQLAEWLVQNELGPLAQAGFRTSWPVLANRLQAEAYAAVAQNALHWRNLALIDAQLARLNIQAVLLKGAAMAATAYQSPEQRSMVDVDLWLRQQDIGPACQIMLDEGFANFVSLERPLALQALAGGEVQFFSGDRPPTLVELHLSPFAGWWLKRTAAVDIDAIWARGEKLDDWHAFYQLAVEDAVIHTAVHLTINHQFGLAALRSLMDIALIDQVHNVDWNIVTERAREWRVATAVWLALYVLQELFGMPDLTEVLQALQPSGWRRQQLLALISPEFVLAGKDLRDGRTRYYYLLLLVDRARDAGKLLARTMWPEKQWLDARYGSDAGHWHHLRRVILRGDV